ncbi:GNAT family N-acetyltransferase/peptidase C39 family protein [Desulfurispirillum indicum]|uniref:GNAT family N-acetyltransferase/peptidase C39 family protein n=1 Tax=Desulfurispirillum indicum TaxID=936456 RepID=UPI001CFB1988|nr:GNAT family N-acetyltransferase/peptidase C39 family protein [Desulfurispirillum indicum]UCZ57445.1 GNAT family N-acetyltransferase/peptidase C39 family protein [Desulfurispirillum indicum]
MGKTIPPFHLRRADLDDLSALVELENRCFTADKLSRRQLRWLMQKGHSAIQLLEVTPPDGPALAAYLLLLFHRGTALARIYSIAVDPAWRGCGFGERLMQEAESLALSKGCSTLRLEVRTDNSRAIELYERMGYRKFGQYADYYEDHTDALRFQKRLRKTPATQVREVPYYQQTLPFTCGPASLLMAMRALDERTEMTRQHELQIWREATTIFMTTGHGGCGPRGLALSAWKRGFDVELWLNVEGPLFVNGVRNPVKKEVLTMVHQDFKEQLEATGVREHLAEVTQFDLQQVLEAGGVPLVLISSWRFSREKSPHWVVVTAMDEQFIYLHDPEVDEEDQKTSVDTQHVPVSRLEFSRMACFGQEKLRTALAVFPAASRQDR